MDYKRIADNVCLAMIDNESDTGSVSDDIDEIPAQPQPKGKGKKKEAEVEEGADDDDSGEEGEDE